MYEIQEICFRELKIMYADDILKLAKKNLSIYNRINQIFHYLQKDKKGKENEQNFN